MRKLIPYVVLAIVIGVMVWAQQSSAALQPPSWIRVTNPSYHVAEVRWGGLPDEGGDSILITCSPGSFCGEILVPSTGDYKQYPISGTHRWKVCVPGPTQDICTPWSTWLTIR